MLILGIAIGIFSVFVVAFLAAVYVIATSGDFLDPETPPSKRRDAR